MFKLKAGNVFEKLNNMNRKQAYTIGAIVAVVLVALLMLASFMGSADDSSLDDFNSRGYDLASMPFVNDEAEQYLLANKYPDMKENNDSLLFSMQEKEDRQAADAEDAEGDDEEEEEISDEENEEGSSASGGSGSGRGGYGGYGGGRGGGGKTSVGQLGNASMGRSGGSGMSGSFGAPRGDYSPYKTLKKGEEKAVEFKNNDARRALSQFAQASRATAGLRDGKLANAKRALQAGNIQGSEAFGDKGIDLSKTGGLALDTNAPIGSNPDLSNLGDKVNDAAQKAEKDKDKEKNKEKSFGEKLLAALGDAVINSVASGVGDMISTGFDNLTANFAGSLAKNDAYKEMTTLTKPPATFDSLNADQQKMFGTAENFNKTQKSLYTWKDANGNQQGNGNWWTRTFSKQSNINSNCPTCQVYATAKGKETRDLKLGSSRSGNNGGNRSWTEYNACVANNGTNCNQYKPK